MTQLDKFTYNLLTNDEVLDINQDVLGKPAGRVMQSGNLEIWSRQLEDGSRAVGLFNRGMFAGKIQMKWSDLGISGKQTLRDVWKQQDIGVFEGSFTADIPSHGVKLLKVTRK